MAFKGRPGGWICKVISFDQFVSFTFISSKSSWRISGHKWCESFFAFKSRWSTLLRVAKNCVNWLLRRYKNKNINWKISNNQFNLKQKNLINWFINQRENLLTTFNWKWINKFPFASTETRNWMNMRTSCVANIEQRCTYQQLHSITSPFSQ